MGKTATPPKFGARQAGATAKFIRVPPRKARFVIDAVRGKYVADALAILKFVPNFAARAIEDVLNSAVANAENGRPNSPESGKPLPPLIRENLKLVRAFVDEGPRIKRLQPRAQGRAYRILKRMCHISVVVEEVEPKPRPVRRPKAGRRAQQAASGGRPAVAKPTAQPAAPAPEAAVPKPEATAPPVEETQAQAAAPEAEPTPSSTPLPPAADSADDAPAEKSE